jgi:serine/threonine protein kinase/Flp pilus assembly protein TadD
MIGQTVTHYRITRQLGAGGMGVVYEARDLRLDRTVALKFLPPELTGDPEAKIRFVHEARAASALDHPNVCSIHEIDETDDGRLFIAMACYEGETLKERLARGPLPLAGALDVAQDIAAGLAKAHAQGITHRDVKPANIFLTRDGPVKILDFGLAKLSHGTQVTRSGSTLGTVAYMAPEQARGEGADQRTDLWSLGAVLYEMVTGLRPFRGDHPQAVVNAILGSEPQPATGLRTGVPPELERVIGRCLEKEAGARYQTAGDLASDLGRVRRALQETGQPTTVLSPGPASRRRWPWLAGAAVVLALALVAVLYPRLTDRGGPPTGGERKRLAVLPFENLGVPDDEYFADGITDAITARLAVVHGFGVISRQSAIQYKGSPKSIQTIGDELGADYVLEGTIQRERASDPTSRLRVIPQLIRVSDDIHLWADTYDEEVAEVFRVQSEIAERVALALSVTLLDTEREALASVPTDNLEAYEFYLRGKDMLSRRYSRENVTTAVQMLERAVNLDPDFAAAWAGLSVAHIWDYYWTVRTFSDRKQEAKAALDRASELDPESPDVQAARGYYYYYGEHDFTRALGYLEAARNNRPNDVDVLSAIAFVKRRQGEWDESAALLEHAAELNPRFVNTCVELGITYTNLRRYERSRRYLDRSIFLDPEHPLGYAYKALVCILADGDTASARRTLLEAAALVSPGELGFDLTPFSLVRILPDTFAGLLERATDVTFTVADTTVFRLGVAEMHLQLGHDEEADRFWREALAVLETTRNPLFQPDIDLYIALIRASLGMGPEAIRITDGILAESPVAADALLGAMRVEMAALVYVRAGAHERAIDQIERLLSIPSQTSRAVLRLDPAWNPLRDDPRFRKLVAGPP